MCYENRYMICLNQMFETGINNCMQTLIKLKKYL